jgi:hypothetical protein
MRFHVLRIQCTSSWDLCLKMDSEIEKDERVVVMRLVNSDADSEL